MIWIAALAWAGDDRGLPADPGCGLASCPVGHEARTCEDNINGDGDCSTLPRDGWQRACMLRNWDKAWQFVVCRPPVCAVPKCPVGDEAQTCSDWFNQDGDCSKLDSQGWKRTCLEAKQGGPDWSLVLCRPAPPPAAPLPSSCGGCATGDDGGLGALALVALGAGRTARRRRK